MREKGTAPQGRGDVKIIVLGPLELVRPQELP